MLYFLHFLFFKNFYTRSFYSFYLVNREILSLWPFPVFPSFFSWLLLFFLLFPCYFPKFFILITNISLTWHFNCSKESSTITTVFSGTSHFIIILNSLLITILWYSLFLFLVCNMHLCFFSLFTKRKLNSQGLVKTVERKKPKISKIKQKKLFYSLHKNYIFPSNQLLNLPWLQNKKHVFSLKFLLPNNSIYFKIAKFRKGSVMGDILDMRVSVKLPE